MVIRGLRQRHGVQADGGEGARHGSDDRRQDGDCQGGVEGVQDQVIPKQLPIPVQGKAGPYRAAAGVVEGKDDEYQNGGVKEHKDQRHGEAAEERGGTAHSITACSSPSPKRFITDMQMTTITIITSATAEPR